MAKRTELQWPGEISIAPPSESTRLIIARDKQQAKEFADDVVAILLQPF